MTLECLTTNICDSITFFEWFPPAEILSDIYSDILCGILSDIYFDSLSDISIPRFYAAFYMTYLFWDSMWHSIWHIFWHYIWHIFWHSFWRSTWCAFQDVIKVCQGSLWSRGCCSAPAGTTAISHLQLKPGGEHSDPGLAVQVRRRRTSRRRRRRSRAELTLKSSNPHLTGGEIQECGMIWNDIRISSVFAFDFVPSRTIIPMPAL